MLQRWQDDISGRASQWSHGSVTYDSWHCRIVVHTWTGWRMLCFFAHQEGACSWLREVIVGRCWQGWRLHNHRIEDQVQQVTSGDYQVGLGLFSHQRSVSSSLSTRNGKQHGAPRDREGRAMLWRLQGQRSWDRRSLRDRTPWLQDWSGMQSTDRDLCRQSSSSDRLKSFHLRKSRSWRSLWSWFCHLWTWLASSSCRQ